MTDMKVSCDLQGHISWKVRKCLFCDGEGCYHCGKTGLSLILEGIRLEDKGKAELGRRISVIDVPVTFYISGLKLELLDVVQDFVNRLFEQEIEYEHSAR